MWVYIAGPLSAPTREQEYQNVERAIKVAIALMHKGHRCTIPHFSQYIADHPDCNFPRTHHFWVGWIDIPIMLRHDALFLMNGWEGSIEATREQRAFKLCRKPIYLSLDEVPNESNHPGFQLALQSKPL